MDLVQIQFYVALVLTLSVVLSLLTFLWTRNNEEGKLQLPLNGHVDNGYELHVEVDPLEVTTPEDLVDGYPVDEDTFWLQMRWRKMGMTILLTLAVALNTITLGYQISDESTRKEIATTALHLVFSVYIDVLACLSIFQDGQEAHSTSIIHLTVLTTVSSVILVVTAILPSTPFPGSEKREIISWTLLASGPEGLRYIVTALYIATSTIALFTPLGPPLYFPLELIYPGTGKEELANPHEENVTRVRNGTPWDTLLFSYTANVVKIKDRQARQIEVKDLPIVPLEMRAAFNYSQIRSAMRNVEPRLSWWTPKSGSGWLLTLNVVSLNGPLFLAVFLLSLVSAGLFYVPSLALKGFLEYLENDPERNDSWWGWVYVVGLFGTNATMYLVTGQLFSLATNTMTSKLKIQLNSLLFAKTLVRKDIASSVSKPKDSEEQPGGDGKSQEEQEFSGKAQIMTLMTTDVGRISNVGFNLFSLIDSPIEIAIGTAILYQLLGVSCFFGLGVIVLSMPLNHYTGTTFINAQENLMKARDERVALMNEILGAMRMLKYMAWERSFEERVMKVRKRELKYQKLHYTVETVWNIIWSTSPILVTLVAFWHYTVVRGQPLTPSVAFTSIVIYNELKFSLWALPQSIIAVLRTFVSLQRVEKYLEVEEVSPVPELSDQPSSIKLRSCTIAWPKVQSQLDQDLNNGDGSSEPGSEAPASANSRGEFQLVDLSLEFPKGEMSLICGKLGSGKTLLLLALLGEAGVVNGQLICPRSPLDALSKYGNIGRGEDWVVEGLCAYVPQTAWLRHASIKDNILFNLPLNEARYQKTLDACALISDLDNLEDGDETEIGEQGITLSGGQKARISLARAVYSRASTIFLDDVLSAVDAHTAQHLYTHCLKGELMEGRTVILVSHHVQLCCRGAAYIVALDNGRVVFEGDPQHFESSGIIRSLGQTLTKDLEEDSEPKEKLIDVGEEASSSSIQVSSDNASNTVVATTGAGDADAAKVMEKKRAKKLIEDETRAEGNIEWSIWMTFVEACGSYWYWTLFVFIFILCSLTPILENGWLKYWSGSALDADTSKDPSFYVGIYAAITLGGVLLGSVRWFVLYDGSIRASAVLYRKLLESVLFAGIRFHDTVSRGTLLNRFGKDFEEIDGGLADDFGRSVMSLLSTATTIITVTIVGGPPFVLVVLVLGTIYYHVSKVYNPISRDLRRLDSASSSPVYTMYGETIAGVPVIRAFGASSTVLRQMFRRIDANLNPFYWSWAVRRWMSIRFNLLSSAIVGGTALVCLITPRIHAPLAGFALAFATSIAMELMQMVHRTVSLEQAMVALERVKEFSGLEPEAPEFLEPRPPAAWPSEGAIKCEGLTVRYAPDLPDVLHDINFEVKPGERIGIIGRTGSGKSTLALSLFRFVEPTKGRIVIDGLDIANVGLGDLRGRLTIIPQDPIILSGTLRSTLDAFGEYEDAVIYEALRRVHLIPAEGEDNSTTEAPEAVNKNVFRDLDHSVSEGGSNFSTGERQLLCMARALLKRSRILVMDEATASVDYATDELIGKTIREEFAQSTILTIAHRLRTVIDYDRVMVLDQGRMVEFDKPQVLLNDPESRFYSLCKATGKEEFANLLDAAGVAE